MKKIIKIVFICVGIFTCKAGMAADHDSTHHLLIAIGGGGSFPGGNFTKTDFSDPKSGFAGSGGNIGISASLPLNKHFGITALVQYQKFSVQGLQTLADSFKEAFAIDSATLYTKGSNYNVNVMVGVYYNEPLSKRLSIEGKALIGLTSAHFAGNQLYFEDQGASTFEQKPATANTVGMRLGADLRYMFTNHFGLELNLAYFYSKPDFSITYDNRNNNAGRWITSYNQPIAGLDAGASIVYKF